MFWGVRGFRGTRKVRLEVRAGEGGSRRKLGGVGFEGRLGGGWKVSFNC